jgi:hypothetical protein
MTKHTKKFLLVGLVILLMWPVTSVSGQDGGEEKILSGGYRITLAAGWELQEEEGGDYRISKDDLALRLILPDVLGEIMTLDEDSDPSKALLDMYEIRHHIRPPEDEINASTEGGRTLFAYEYKNPQENSQGIAMIMVFSPGRFAYCEMLMIGSTELAEEHRAEMMDIVLSLKEPCKVQAKTDYVDLRVGPGLNRGAFTTMKTGEYVPVLGQATVTDGGQWWRLDISSQQANELWVADEDVMKQGDCDSVGEVPIPPIILPLPPSISPESTALNSTQTPLRWQSSDFIPPSMPGDIYIIIRKTTAPLVYVSVAWGSFGQQGSLDLSNYDGLVLHLRHFQSDSVRLTVKTNGDIVSIDQFGGGQYPGEWADPGYRQINW